MSYSIWSWTHELILFKFKACTSLFASASSPVKTFGKSVTCIDYSVRSGLVLTGHSDFNVRLSDPRAEGQVIKSTRKSHKGLVSSVAWKPDSDVLFASSSYDKTVKIWDVRSEIPLFTIKGGSAKLFCACWSGMDGDVIATGGAQKVLKRFRIKNWTREIAQPFFCHSGVGLSPPSPFSSSPFVITTASKPVLSQDQNYNKRWLAAL